MNDKNMDDKKIQAKMLVDPKCGSAQFIIKSDKEFRKYIQKIVLETIHNDMNKEVAATGRINIKETISKCNVPYIKQNFSDYVLSNNLKYILKARGISLEKLAELIGVSRNTMTSIVNNRGISAINMFKISLVLGLPIEKIFKYRTRTLLDMIEAVDVTKNEVEYE